MICSQGGDATQDPKVRRTTMTLPAPLICRIAAALTAIMTAALLPAPARAQQVVALVNGEPITALDVSQRAKLIEISNRKAPTRQEALEELIDEKLKLHIARRYKLDISEKEVDTSFNGIAQRAGSTPEQFTQALLNAGITAKAVKNRLKAEMAWNQIIRGKFSATFQTIRERDIHDTLVSRRKDDQTVVGYEYTLRPILLIIPRGSSEGAREARRKEAENLRARFQGCEEGVTLARQLKDVAVRDLIYRTSAEFTAQLREILDKTPEGRLTPPEQTQQGIEFYAICAKKQSTSEVPGKREVREELMNQRFVEQGKNYLKELRANAMIEYR
jgi:peptidyl-prolyl cis-trans isomerase SurA